MVSGGGHGIVGGSVASRVGTRICHPAPLGSLAPGIRSRYSATLHHGNLRPIPDSIRRGLARYYLNSIRVLSAPKSTQLMEHGGATRLCSSDRHECESSRSTMS